jgi:Cu(I)/Ag(I) efflux system membrane fusion protein
MMFGTATVTVPLRNILAVPASAVINTGERQVVWEEIAENRFTPRHVTTGHRIGDWIEIVEGLEAGATVASSGGFLIDSESQLMAITSAAAAAAAAGGGQPDPPQERPVP